MTDTSISSAEVPASARRNLLFSVAGLCLASAFLSYSVFALPARLELDNANRIVAGHLVEMLEAGECPAFWDETPGGIALALERMHWSADDYRKFKKDSTDPAC